MVSFGKQMREYLPYIAYLALLIPYAGIDFFNTAVWIFSLGEVVGLLGFIGIFAPKMGYLK